MYQPTRQETDPKRVFGNTEPPLVSVEKNSSAYMVIDAGDRTFGTPFNFRVELRDRLSRARFISLQKVIMPKVNNVNAGNNTFTVVHDLGTAQVTLTPGMYNTTTLANELTARINAAFVTAGIADTVTTSYDPNRRAFSITSVGGDNWYITSESDFIVYGEYLAPFQSLPAGSPTATSVTYSGIAGMLPCRYFTISSDALAQYDFSNSVLSSQNTPANVIGVVDVSQIYDVEDFDVTTPYSGVYKTVSVDGPRLCVVSPGQGLNSNVDIRIVDGFGRDPSAFYGLTAPYPTEVSVTPVLTIKIDF